MDEDGPISRDLHTKTGNSFGNITDNMNLTNLMSDPLGTDIVAGLTGPTDAQSLPTDSTENMGQPPQVDFNGGDGKSPTYTPEDEKSDEFNADELSVEGLMEKVKNIPWWGWLVGASAVVGGATVYNKMK